MLTRLLWWARYLRALWHTRDNSWSMALADLGLSPILFERGPEPGTIVIKELNVVVTRSRHHFMLERLKYLLALRDFAGASFSFNQEGDLIVTMGDVRVIVRTRDNLGVLHEVFVEQVYNFKFTAPCVVWDIGMNVGYASLYFSTRPEVVAVYGYEPFADTHAAARRNIEMSSKAAAVVHTVNAGVSGADGAVRREYSAQYQGRMSTLPERPSSVPANTALQEEQVLLKDAAEALAGIVAAHPGIDVYAKVDCEGSEYDILSRLSRVNSLRSIKAFAIEWHDGKPGDMTQQLTDAGFASIETHHPGGRYGAIYAFRTERASE